MSLKIDVGAAQAAKKTLVQVADVHNRQRYKYTEWEEESAQPTPLLMYTLTPEAEESVLNQLPKAVLEREIPRVYFMRMPKPCPESVSLPPHIDRGRRAAVNIYLECGGETTQFFDADDSKKELKLVESFVAKPGEAWLMDVSKPHAVRMAEAMERTGVSLSFKRVRFAELAEMMESV